MTPIRAFLVAAVCLTLSATAAAAPTVSLTAPPNNASYLQPVTLTVSASATASTGTTLTKVEFYAGATLVGTDTTSPYSISWANVPAGVHSLTAKAWESTGAATTSAARTITVSATNTAPTVSLSGPANNSTFVSPTAITVSASAKAPETNDTVAKVEFYAGTTLIGTDTTSPYSISWASPPAGVHTLTARATDGQGAVTTSAARTVTVNAENLPPTVSLSAPANNSSYVSPASVTVSASAKAPETNDTVAKVEFYAGTALIGTDTTSPYSISWASPPAGVHTLTVRAYDGRGAVTTSAARTVTVSTSNAPPSVSLTAPAAGSSYTAPASITLSASAADSDGSIAGVAFYQGGTLIGSGTLTGGSYTYTWSAAAGSYSLTARAVDNQGAATTSAPVAVTVTDPPPPPVAAGVYYVYADHLNTPRVITDGTNKVVWRWDSDPFGADAANEDPDGDGTKFRYNLRFPGQYYDRETGLHYNYFRDYDPSTGRYVESDPIGLKGGINTFSYVRANPLSFTDTKGLFYVYGHDLGDRGYRYTFRFCNRTCMVGQKVGRTTIGWVDRLLAAGKKISISSGVEDVDGFKNQLECSKYDPELQELFEKHGYTPGMTGGTYLTDEQARQFLKDAQQALPPDVADLYPWDDLIPMAKNRAPRSPKRMRPDCCESGDN
jgi:RHS repeat-associated protein